MVIVQRLVDFVTLLNAMEALIESSRNGDQQIAIEEIIHQCRTAWFHEWNGQRSFSFLFLFFSFCALRSLKYSRGNVRSRLTGIGSLIFLFVALRRQYFLVLMRV